MTTTYTDYDSPWKEALELYFPEFLALCFPEAHSEIDWARGYEFLDKELQQVVREAELEQTLWQDMQDYEEASRMTYVTSVERFGIEKGLKQGQQLGLIARGREAVLDVVEVRFASVPETVAQRVNRIEDAAWLKRLLRQAVLTPSLAEFTQWLEQAVSEQAAAGEDKPEAAVSAGG
jgi:hypothetical protein